MENETKGIRIPGLELSYPTTWKAVIALTVVCGALVFGFSLLPESAKESVVNKAMGIEGPENQMVSAVSGFNSDIVIERKDVALRKANSEIKSQRDQLYTLQDSLFSLGEAVAKITEPDEVFSSINLSSGTTDPTPTPTETNSVVDQLKIQSRAEDIRKEIERITDESILKTENVDEVIAKIARTEEQTTDSISPEERLETLAKDSLAQALVRHFQNKVHWLTRRNFSMTLSQIIKDDPSGISGESTKSEILNTLLVLVDLDVLQIKYEEPFTYFELNKASPTLLKFDELVKQFSNDS